ncbi:bifunctional [glutamine synthetase] adenylyltransferase/[glutamine synthetase]-adenylyl-L-tyrosine phosphorylase [Tessaracoccus sp. OH4464_COT-324]|uniref:bifunctional [glutamine synthetase] adenylyltransferase/[glutamine synthetase]-adenylyl-L-tyrosine phosphorylase n=1 Tax=Tessaracoccus sp. OH4464_COT-324 TaxID=2491059 RepID=UPI000F636B71|nr:bifunctional [glutamine synthetase] adenylyltransferase/[glutamine synthetase]-adenylyl-L-tyrosine phosphorylase [Tessaracoccus sp. OH4464_COT-324]RRD46011.1 bifunctional [glutamine synthetase] adenylyltransferase/[glutamine synthetase]-adenylyl-L-tyrosine phosphorylase [Tessaracoccus sp. OH4464_COT-324]
MGRIQSSSAEFARRGFESATAAARIWDAWPAEQRAMVDLALFGRVGDRFQALETLDRLRATDRFEAIAADPGWLERVLRVAGASSVLAAGLRTSPETVQLLAEEPRERDERAWAAFFQARVPVVDGECHRHPDELRSANRAALTLIAARDLAADDPTEIVEGVARELSHVADCVLETSLALARAETPGWQAARLAIVALGKAGGQELNYLSDVDVLYIAEPTEGADPDEAAAIANRVAAAQARICSAHTKAGTIWSVDASLRPEGKAGPLVRSLASCRRYYDQWAENWEFQALLKARPAAGDLGLGEAFIDLVSPLVWRSGERPGFLPEMRAMRERVIAHIPDKQAETEIKLSEGGLRDTEFSVQLLQLVHGRADDRIRDRGTLPALRSLVSCGYIGRSDGSQLAQHYRFQRVLEHRAQLVNLRRTHVVPDDDRLAQFARAGLDDARARWRTSRRDVRRLRQRIFFSPLLDTVVSLPADTLLSPDAVKERMRALGFNDPRTALGHMQALTAGTSRAAEILRQLMPAMLEWIALGPNPDFGLLAFRQLCETLGESPWFLRGLRDEGYMATRLAKVASTSRFTVDLLKRAPDTVGLLASDEALTPRSAAELGVAMGRSAARHADLARALDSARAFRRSELCRVALRDVLGGVDIVECGRALSALASATVQTALDIARRAVDAPELGIIALGRWGGEEMSYASDLDCIFVVADDAGPAGLAAATELVRELARILKQPGVEGITLDADLRPEGKGGPQVRTVSSYRKYYERWGAVWEAQMLLRARHGAGSAELVQAVLDDIDPVRYPERLTDDAVREIRRLKSRMERERIPAGVDPSRHLKLGPGGLSDIEWTIQLIQLAHAHRHPELRTTSTLGALAAARALGLVAPGDADALSAAWRHASTVRDAIMLVRGRPSDALPTNTRELAAVAALLGHDAPVAELGENTRRHARLAGAVVGRLFWGE